MPLKWFVKRMFIKFIPFWFLMLMRNLIFRNKKTRPRDLLKFEVHLADHCNLNCIGCNNFSPIAEPYLLDVESFRKDCERISKLAGRKIGDLFLLGGEPLLHPHINEILIIVGQSFDIYNASIVTNGILLLKMTEDFWKCCKENRIKIIITKYPINLNFEVIENIAENHGVRLEYFGKTGEELKEMVLVPLDLEGRQNITQNFRICMRSNECITLKEGKLYTCSLVPHIVHFNKYFEKNLPVTESDYIDIYKAANIAEILSFLSKPIPFCRHCKIKKTIGGIKWSVSKKEINEWL